MLLRTLHNEAPHQPVKTLIPLDLYQTLASRNCKDWQKINRKCSKFSLISFIWPVFSMGWCMHVQNSSSSSKLETAQSELYFLKYFQQHADKKKQTGFFLSFYLNSYEGKTTPCCELQRGQLTITKEEFLDEWCQICHCYWLTVIFLLAFAVSVLTKKGDFCHLPISSNHTFQPV